MNFLCHVNCCNNRGVIPGVTYHKFPKTVAELWFSVHNIPIRKVENVSEMTVCSDHFKLEDYADTESGMKLKNGAVPSLYLKISKQDASETNISSNNKEDESCIVEINNLQLPSEHDKVTILQNNHDTALVEKNRDKSLEFADIITIADSSDMLTVINSMHNYSVSVETHVYTEPQNQHSHEENLEQDNNLLKEKIRRLKKASCFKNRHKFKNQKKTKKDSSHFKNIEEDTDKMDEEEIMENVILDHDYTTPEDLGELQNVDNAYNIICSENYVWKLKKQLGIYSKKTRLLRKRVDSLKSIVNVLKKRIF